MLFTGKCALTKQKVQLNAVTKWSCEEKYKSYGIEQNINDGRLCAGGDELYDTCAGMNLANGNINSELMVMRSVSGYGGAPLMEFDRNANRWTLVGVGSLGPACEGIGTPGIYTRIGPYIDWILENIEGRNIIISY